MLTYAARTSLPQSDSKRKNLVPRAPTTLVYLYRLASLKVAAQQSARISFPHSREMPHPPPLVLPPPPDCQLYRLASLKVAASARGSEPLEIVGECFSESVLILIPCESPLILICVLVKVPSYSFPHTHEQSPRSTLRAQTVY